MKKPINVLIFPAGMENGLEILKALQGCKEVRLFGASSPEQNQAFYVFKDVNIVRTVRTEGWLDDLNQAIRKHDIDIVFPANSTVIDHISVVREQVLAPVLLPSKEVIEVTRSKTATLKALCGTIPLPEVYTSLQNIPTFPVFAKPDRGYGSQGACLIENADQARALDFTHHIVQQHLPGKEYSVDCFSTMDGQLLFSGARERSRVRMGTSMHAEVVTEALEQRLRGYAEQILTRIPLTGAWFFQVKEDHEGTLRLLEIDARIAGTMCFHRNRGINFPLLSILQYFGKPVSTLISNVPFTLDRCLRNRYRFEHDYDSVFVDLDDTLIVHDRLNIELVTFLYQCVNQGKRIILISKHLGADIYSHLRQWRISELFDEILWLEEDESKADCISSKRSIFIDDSFSQRKEVHLRHGIPTFDPSMVEVLLDERI